MILLLNILLAIAKILDTVVTIYAVILFARVILSWVHIPANQIVYMIYRATEPVLAPIRRRMPLSLGIDFSPIIVFLLLMVFKIVVIQTMYQYIAIQQFKYVPG